MFRRLIVASQFFLLGLNLAFLLAPHSGQETRRLLRDEGFSGLLRGGQGTTGQLPS